jgi:hypothetical protein
MGMPFLSGSHLYQFAVEALHCGGEVGIGDGLMVGFNVGVIVGAYLVVGVGLGMITLVGVAVGKRLQGVPDEQ